MPEFHPFPTLYTERLTLRQISLSDLDTVHLLRSHPVVNEYIQRPEQTKKDSKAFIKRILESMLMGQNINWALDLEDVLIGTICLWNFSADGLSAEVGYDSLLAYQGQGYMSEALSAVMNYGYERLGLERHYAYTHHANEASIRLLERHRFKRDISLVDDDVPTNVVYVHHVEGRGLSKNQ